MTQTARAIIGKTITGMISRPGPGGQDSIVMLQFSDGTCFEFISPAARRALGRGQGGRPADVEHPIPQMTMFPLDGEPAAVAA